MNFVRLAALSLLFCCVHLPLLAQSAGGDNRYCGPNNEAQFGKSDGPALMPQSCFYTALSATPTTGNLIHVARGSDLQLAINKARCGDTLELQAGSVFRGRLDLPAKGCDDNHWIVLRSSGQLPPEGKRINPCYAGVGSLPGRPQFTCNSHANEMAKIVMGRRESVRISDHYRLIGLEITREDGAGTVYNLITADNAKKIILDRVWVHGNDREETVRGLAIPGASYVAVIDSYFSDFHCIARTGACTDSQAVWGGAGDIAGGTYKIVNNYLEAAAEGVMFGGGAGSTTPADIEIRRNYFFKPLVWKPSDTSYQGIPFIVKNNFELKNGARVLLEGNIMENSWGGFTQKGFQVLLTPKSQGNKCPECVVHDIVIRYCLLRHSASGINLSAAPSDLGGHASGLFNVSIHDVTIEDISGARFDGSGFAFQLGGDGSPYHDISIRHVTVPSADRVLLLLGAPQGSPLQNISFTDNILGVSEHPIASTGGGVKNCMYRQPSPKAAFDACWRNYAFSHNVLVDGHGEWPQGNFFAKDLQAAGVSAGSQSESLRTISHSQYRGKASDGHDVGADISALKEEIAGVGQ